jgi:hypothetical protein
MPQQFGLHLAQSNGTPQVFFDLQRQIGQVILFGSGRSSHRSLSWGIG